VVIGGADQSEKKKKKRKAAILNWVKSVQCETAPF
jgi:hypothetical protein